MELRNPLVHVRCELRSQPHRALKRTGRELLWIAGASVALHALALAVATTFQVGAYLDARQAGTLADEESVPAFVLDLRGQECLVLAEPAQGEPGDADEVDRPPEFVLEPVADEPACAETAPLEAPTEELAAALLPEPAPPDDPLPPEPETALPSVELPEPLPSSAAEALPAVADAQAPAREQAAVSQRTLPDWVGALTRRAASLARSSVRDAGADARVRPARSREGGSEVGAAPAPRLLEAPPPPYPARCQRENVEGRVLCRMHVDVRGRVVQVDVVESSGDARLDEAARRALERWRFQPPLWAGRAIESRVLHWVTFRLR